MAIISAWSGTVLSWNNYVPTYQNSAIGAADVTAGYKCHYEVSGNNGSVAGYNSLIFSIICNEGGTSPSTTWISMRAPNSAPFGWSYATPSLGWMNNIVDLSLDVTFMYRAVDTLPEGTSAAINLGVGTYGNDSVITPPRWDIQSAVFYPNTRYGTYTHTQHFDITADTRGGVNIYANQAFTVSLTGASDDKLRFMACYSADYDYKKYDYTGTYING
jgi:hypothetical protein